MRSSWTDARCRRAGSALYIALNKPRGITSTTERDVAGNIVDFVGHRERIFPIGRLDKDSEGLILLTNDGDIVNEILRVEHGHEKEYLVTVEPPVTDNFLSMMAKGVRIGGEKTKPCTVTRTGRDEFRMVLTQGLNRQIRRMCSALGWRVKRLVRVRIMHIRLGDARERRWRELRTRTGTGRAEAASPGLGPARYTWRSFAAHHG